MKKNHTTLGVWAVCLLLVFGCNLNGSATPESTATPEPTATPTPDPGSRIADHTVIHRLWNGEIPEAAVQQAVDSLYIGYGHTSHGSQIISGMEGLVGFANGGNLGGTDYTQNLFQFSNDGSVGLHLYEGTEYSDEDYLDHDCGYSGWDDLTRKYLNEVPGVNVIIWSWCGQVGSVDINSHYLNRMAALESEYPGVTFVYMTGHLDGVGETGSVHLNNEAIRQYCRDNNKWLFDFADIESHGPDGTYYSLCDDGCNYDADGDGNLETDGGDPGNPTDGDRNWALDWQNSHTQDEDWYSCGAAHSRPLNANMKAYAAWWLWSRIAGWVGD